MADPLTINWVTHLLSAAHKVERIADRETNIGEWVVFAVSGVLEELAVLTYRPLSAMASFLVSLQSSQASDIALTES